MSEKSKPKGKKVIDWALSITGEVRAEREMLEKKHPELKRVFLGFQHLLKVSIYVTTLKFP